MRHAGHVGDVGDSLVQAAVGGLRSVVIGVQDDIAVLVQVIADALDAVVGQFEHRIVVHLVQEGQAVLQIFLGLGARLGDQVEAVVAAGGQGAGLTVGILGDGSDHRHRGGGGGIHNARYVVAGEVVPDTLGTVHGVQEAAGFALLAAVLPGGGVDGCPVGTDQTVLIDLAHPLQGFLVLGRLMDRDQFAVLLDPLVAAAEPGLDHVQRSGVLAQLEAVGVVHAVAVRVIVGEGVEHVVDILDGLGRLGDAHGFRPVGAVGQAVAADGTGTGDADDLSVNGQALQNVLVGLAQVGVALAVLQVAAQIPERALLGGVDDVGIQRAGSGQDHRHVVLVHQGQAELVLVGIVGLKTPFDGGVGVILVGLDDLVGVVVGELGAVEGGDHKGDGRAAAGFRGALGGSRSGAGRGRAAGTAATGQGSDGHRDAQGQGDLLFHELFSSFFYNTQTA